MGSTKEKIAELEEQELKLKPTAHRMPTMKYEKTSDWNFVRQEMFSLLNAFTPPTIDTGKYFRNEVQRILESVLEDYKIRYQYHKENGFTIAMAECEAVIMAVNDIVEQIGYVD